MEPRPPTVVLQPARTRWNPLEPARTGGPRAAATYGPREAYRPAGRTPTPALEQYIPGSSSSSHFLFVPFDYSTLSTLPNGILTSFLIFFP